MAVAVVIAWIAGASGVVGVWPELVEETVTVAAEPGHQAAEAGWHLEGGHGVEDVAVEGHLDAAVGLDDDEGVSTVDVETVHDAVAGKADVLAADLQQTSTCDWMKRSHMIDFK